MPHENTLSDSSIPSPASFGLLLDVDGPISSPVTRTLRAPGLADSLVALANSGVPIAFNTGRSDDFLIDRVLPPLVSAGLRQDTAVWGIGEKGGTWFHLAQQGQVEIDPAISLPDAILHDIRQLAEESYADLVFFDETKRTMASLEQRISVSAEHYAQRRHRLDLDIAAIVRDHGERLTWEGRSDLSDPQPTIRIDPTIIATDIEHVTTGKDTGAARFLALLHSTGTPLPGRWFTMGDSRTDYAMATWLHQQGHQVSHVDVRPSDGILSVPYEVLTHPTLIHDDAGAWFMARWASEQIG
ncbi:hypothetical protein [Jonesia quinghaiensis]|uniref:hypothetical protein n=1 Tax=Jonesia quinghaiensis TaxID=262806 RepID=UPI00048DB296|nr:hypothetical protein [Jonesia quinghaiensis]